MADKYHWTHMLPEAGTIREYGDRILEIESKIERLHQQLVELNEEANTEARKAGWTVKDFLNARKLAKQLNSDLDPDKTAEKGFLTLG